MATYAARRLVADGRRTPRAIVAIELLAAAQGVELRRAADDVANARRGASRSIRGSVAFWERDRAFAPDLEAIRARVERGEFVPSAPA